MNIYSFGCVKQVVGVADTTRTEISISAKKLLLALREINRTAEQKGKKVANTLHKTEKCTRKLAKNSEQGNINGVLKNLSKLQKNSEKLFYQTSSPFTRNAIAAATEQLSDIKYYIGTVK